MSAGQLRRWDAAQELLPTPMLTGRSLSIDVEGATACAARLDALADVVADLSSVLNAQRAVAPGFDDVSRNIAAQGDRMFRDARLYLTAWHDDIVRAAEALRGQLDAYMRADSQAVSRA